MQIERNLGVDVIMQFDHVIPGQSDENAARDASERSIRWLERCVAALERLRAGGPPPNTTIPQTSLLPGTTFPLPEPSHPQALFPIVQGGIHEHLRREAARDIRNLGDWQGYGIGGLSVGEAKPDMYRILEVVDAELPPDRPRYLMVLDEKSNGFDLEHSALHCPKALTRLLLVHAAAILYLVSQGTQVASSGQRRTMDPHWFRGPQLPSHWMELDQGSIDSWMAPHHANMLGQK